jgi:hypothetical protein
MGQPDTTKIKGRKDAATQKWFDDKYFKKPTKPVVKKTTPPEPRKDDATQEWFDKQYFGKNKKKTGLVPKGQWGLKTYNSPMKGNLLDSFPTLFGKKAPVPTYLPLNKTGPIWNYKPAAPKVLPRGQAFGEQPIKVDINPNLDLSSRLGKTHLTDVLIKNELARSGGDQLQGKDRNFKEDGANPNKSKTEGRVMPNMIPVLNAANLIQESLRARKIRDLQLRRPKIYQPGYSISESVRKDMPPEVLAQMERALSRVRNPYGNTSDPVLTMLGNQQATAERDDMEANFIAQRGQFIDATDKDKLKDHQANQEIAGKTQAENTIRQQDFADFDLGANTAFQEHQKKAGTNFINNMVGSLNNAAQYNLSAEGLTMQNMQQEKQDRLNRIAMLPTEGERSIALAAYDKDYPAGYASKLIPRYGQAMRGAINPQFLTKLFGERKMQSLA